MKEHETEKSGISLLDKEQPLPSKSLDETCDSRSLNDNLLYLPCLNLRDIHSSEDKNQPYLKEDEYQTSEILECALKEVEADEAESDDSHAYLNSRVRLRSRIIQLTNLVKKQEKYQARVQEEHFQFESILRKTVAEQQKKMEESLEMATREEREKAQQKLQGLQGRSIEAETEAMKLKEEISKIMTENRSVEDRCSFLKTHLLSAGIQIESAMSAMNQKHHWKKENPAFLKAAGSSDSNDGYETSINSRSTTGSRSRVGTSRSSEAVKNVNQAIKMVSELLDTALNIPVPSDSRTPTQNQSIETPDSAAEVERKIQKVVQIMKAQPQPTVEARRGPERTFAVQRIVSNPACPNRKSFQTKVIKSQEDEKHYEKNYAAEVTEKYSSRSRHSSLVRHSNVVRHSSLSRPPQPVKDFCRPPFIPSGKAVIWKPECFPKRPCLNYPSSRIGLNIFPPLGPVNSHRINSLSLSSRYSPAVSAEGSRRITRAQPVAQKTSCLSRTLISRTLPGNHLQHTVPSYAETQELATPQGSQNLKEGFCTPLGPPPGSPFMTLSPCSAIPKKNNLSIPVIMGGLTPLRSLDRVPMNVGLKKFPDHNQPADPLENSGLSKSVNESRQRRPPLSGGNPQFAAVKVAFRNKL